MANGIIITHTRITAHATSSINCDIVNPVVCLTLHNASFVGIGALYAEKSNKTAAKQNYFLSTNP